MTYRTAPTTRENASTIQQSIDKLSERDPNRSLLQGRMRESVVSRVQESAQNLASRMTATDAYQNESTPGDSSDVPQRYIPNESYFLLSPFEKPMMSQILSIKEGNTFERRILNFLVQKAKEYQEENPIDAKVHLFITCPKNSNGNDEKGDFHLFTMVSNLFHMVLKASSPGNTTSAQGYRMLFSLRDTLRIEGM